MGGVIIEYDTSKTRSLAELAGSIAAEFVELGLAATAVPVVKTNAANAEIIHLIVGKK